MFYAPYMINFNDIRIEEEKPQQGLENFEKEFLNDRKNEYLQLIGFLEKNDFSSIDGLAHKWKGFSKPYGFMGLETLAIEVQKSIKDNNRKELGKYIELIRDYLERKEAHLSRD